MQNLIYLRTWCKQRKRVREKETSEAEIELILGEMDLQKKTLFSSSVVSGTSKSKVWRKVLS